jgi:hypothetical protein
MVYPNANTAVLARDFEAGCVFFSKTVHTSLK